MRPQPPPAASDLAPDPTPLSASHAAQLAEGYVASVGFQYGEPKRLYHGLDYLGNVCGLGKTGQSKSVDRGLQMDMEKLPNWYMFNIEVGGTVTNPTYGMMVLPLGP